MTTTATVNACIHPFVRQINSLTAQVVNANAQMFKLAYAEAPGIQ
jgi:flagellar hook-associated protein FlgK